MIRRVGPSDVPVLMTGESGTGKELVARAIRQQSGRKDQAFVAINCGAIPETLLESELFGYEKGPLRGATQQRKGRIESAQGGTLFLDEIGDIPLGVASQAVAVLARSRDTTAVQKKRWPSTRGFSQRQVSIFKRLSARAGLGKGLTAYDWPGNVRELENRIKRAVVMAEGKYVTPMNLELKDPSSSDEEASTLRAWGRGRA